MSQVGLVYVRGCEIEGLLDDSGKVIEEGTSKIITFIVIEIQNVFYWYTMWTNLMILIFFYKIIEWITKNTLKTTQRTSNTKADLE